MILKMKRYFNLHTGKVKPFVIKANSQLNDNLIMRDNDGDGLPNKLDCEPNDYYQQGILHKAGAYVARKTGNEEKAQRFEKAGVESDYNKKGKAYIKAEERAEDKEKYDKAKEETRQRQREVNVAAKEERIRQAPERRAERRVMIKQKIGAAVESAKKSAATVSSKKSAGKGFVSGGLSNTNSVFGMSGGGIMGNNQNNKANYGGGMNFGGMDIMNPQGKPKPTKKKKKVRKESKSKQKVKIIRRTKPKKGNNNFVTVNGKKYFRR